MNLWEDRLINGFVKMFAGKIAPEGIVNSLAQDVVIHAPADRAFEDDLWPCIWALAATLERQFRGEIFIDAGLDQSLPAPAPLGSRCHFKKPPTKCHVGIGLGMKSKIDSPIQIFGDARSNTISFAALLPPERQGANPTSSFALAGYLSYSALAHVVGVPPFRGDDCVTTLDLPSTGKFDPSCLINTNLSVLGLGHIGNAYLALLFFISRRFSSKPQLILIDKDRIESLNWTTNILLTENQSWIGMPKVDALAQLTRTWGHETISLMADINWGWTAPPGSRYAMLGFDNFTARRIAIAAGYDWLIDSGVGTSFERPRISWHSLPPDNGIAKRLFGQVSMGPLEQNIENTPFSRHLKSENAGCGWLIFQGIQASAPSMGLVAAAYAWCELQIAISSGNRVPIQGSTYLWSPLLPFWRRTLNGKDFTF